MGVAARMKGKLSDSLSSTSFMTRIFPSLAVALSTAEMPQISRYHKRNTEGNVERREGAGREGGRRKRGAGFVIGAFSVSTLKITALICGGAQALLAD